MTHLPPNAAPTAPAGDDRAVAVAIVGAGVAGLACARALRAAGVRVVVFEKSRGLGGRAATRRAATALGELQFDHGAQYFTARDPEFAAEVRGWETSGHAARWTARIAVVDRGSVREPPSPAPERWVGTPGMSAVGRALAEGLDVRLATRVAAVERRAARWAVADEAGVVLGDFSAVVVATPATQAAMLLQAAAPLLGAAAAAVRMTPCWSAMLAFAAPLPLAFDGAFVGGRDGREAAGSLAPPAGTVASRALSWLARDSSKPERAHGGAECWVAHATAEWSAAHLDASPDDVAAALAREFAVETGADTASGHVSAHRWRFATPAPALDERFLYDSHRGVGACGDWCGGPRVEGAYTSGRALARRILQHRAG